MNDYEKSQEHEEPTGLRILRALLRALGFFQQEGKLIPVAAANRLPFVAVDPFSQGEQN